MWDFICRTPRSGFLQGTALFPWYSVIPLDAEPESAEMRVILLFHLSYCHRTTLS